MLSSRSPSIELLLVRSSDIGKKFIILNIIFKISGMYSFILNNCSQLKVLQTWTLGIILRWVRSDKFKVKRDVDKRNLRECRVLKS